MQNKRDERTPPGSLPFDACLDFTVGSWKYPLEGASPAFPGAAEASQQKGCLLPSRRESFQARSFINAIFVRALITSKARTERAGLCVSAAPPGTFGERAIGS